MWNIMYEFLRTMPIALLTGCDQWANVDFLMQFGRAFYLLRRKARRDRGRKQISLSRQECDRPLLLASMLVEAPGRYQRREAMHKRLNK